MIASTSGAGDRLRLGGRALVWCAALTLLALALFLVAKSRVLPVMDPTVTFDGKFYLSIFEDGYRFSGDIEEKQNSAFLPLTAGMIGAATALVPGSNRFLEVLLLGVAVLFASLVGLYRLSLDLSDERVARLSTLLWASSPMALYNFVGYTEPTFALLCVWAFVALERQRFWAAAVLTAIALLGRPQGVVLAAFVAFAIFRHARWRPRELLAGNGALQLCAMGVPLMVFATWQALAFDDSIAYVNSLEAWRRGSFMDGNLGFAPAFQHFFSAVSNEAATLSHWTTLLAALTLMVIAGVLACAPGAPRWLTAFYLSLLAFLFASASFDATNIARHTFFMFPWAMLLALALSRLASSSVARYAALLPWIFLACVINFEAVARYYTGEWVS